MSPEFMPFHFTSRPVGVTGFSDKGDLVPGDKGHGVTTASSRSKATVLCTHGALCTCHPVDPHHTEALAPSATRLGHPEPVTAGGVRGWGGSGCRPVPPFCSVQAAPSATRSETACESVTENAKSTNKQAHAVVPALQS